jgi:hypothetical protein
LIRRCGTRFTSPSIACKCAAKDVSVKTVMRAPWDGFETAQGERALNRRRRRLSCPCRKFHPFELRVRIGA